MQSDRDTERRLRKAREFMVEGLKRLPLPDRLKLNLGCETGGPDRREWILDLSYVCEGEEDLHGRTRIKLPSDIGPEDPLWGRLLARGLARAIGSLAEQQTTGPVLAIWRSVEDDAQALEGPRLLSWGFF